jgi:hypothetical protein
VWLSVTCAGQMGGKGHHAQPEVVILAGMMSLEYKHIIAEISRDIVAQTAPAELPLFRAISESYAKNPEKTLKVHQGKDEDLGFGGSEEVALLMTPIVLEVVKTIVKYLADEIKKSLEKETHERIDQYIKKIFKKYGTPKDKQQPSPDQSQLAPGLNTAQLKQVRQLAFEKARQLALPEEQAGLLADSIIGSLTILH